MFRAIKAITGNIIYRITGSTILVDAEWNMNFNKLPSKKDWKMLGLFFIIMLGVFIFFIVYNYSALN